MRRLLEGNIFLSEGETVHFSKAVEFAKGQLFFWTISL